MTHPQRIGDDDDGHAQRRGSQREQARGRVCRHCAIDGDAPAADDDLVHAVHDCSHGGVGDERHWHRLGPARQLQGQRMPRQHGRTDSSTRTRRRQQPGVRALRDDDLAHTPGLHGGEQEVPHARVVARRHDDVAVAQHVPRRPRQRDAGGVQLVQQLVHRVQHAATDGREQHAAKARARARARKHRRRCSSRTAGGTSPSARTSTTTARSSPCSQRRGTRDLGIRNGA